MICSLKLKVLLEVKNSRNQPLAVVNSLKKLLKIGPNPKEINSQKLTSLGMKNEVNLTLPWHQKSSQK